MTDKPFSVPNQEVERVARAISAARMKLLKDPLGERLPDDLWRQSIPHAERAIAAMPTPSQPITHIEGEG